MPLTGAWWNAPAFYPSTGVLAFSENLLGLAPITAPIIARHRLAAARVQHGIPPQLRVQRAGRVLAGVRADALSRRIVRRGDRVRVRAIPAVAHAASAAALVVLDAGRDRGASPFRRGAEMAMGGAVRRELAAAGAGLRLLPVLPLDLRRCCGWRGSSRAGCRSGRRRGSRSAWLVAACALAPVLSAIAPSTRRTASGGVPVEVVNYSADVAGLLSASPDSLLWSWLHAPRQGRSPSIFPGPHDRLLLLLASALGGWRLWCQPLQAPATGPAAVRFTRSARADVDAVARSGARSCPATPIGVPGPYALSPQLPGFDGMRVPARLWMVVGAVPRGRAAFVVARIESRRARRLAIAVATARHAARRVAAGVPGRGRARHARSPPAPRGCGSDFRCTRPKPRRCSARSRRGGASSTATADTPRRSTPRCAICWSTTIRRSSTGSPRPSRSRSSSSPPAIADGRWNDVRAAPCRRADARTSGPDWTGYEIARSPARSRRRRFAARRSRSRGSRRRRTRRDINAVLDGDLDTRWHIAPQARRRNHHGRLSSGRSGSPPSCSASARTPGQYPRGLEIDVSADGVTWSPVYAGGTALETYDAARPIAAGDARSRCRSSATASGSCGCARPEASRDAAGRSSSCALSGELAPVRS